MGIVSVSGIGYLLHGACRDSLLDLELMKQADYLIGSMTYVHVARHAAVGLVLGAGFVIVSVMTLYAEQTFGEVIHFE